MKVPASFSRQVFNTRTLLLRSSTPTLYLRLPVRFTQPCAYSTKTDDISIEQYHKVSNETLDTILENFERLGERYSAVDVELSQGVLSLDLPPNGSYVINKQPANKQIWSASPLSGPKRFDLINGKWTSLRDGSVLGDDLRAETKIVTDSLNLEPVLFEGVDDDA
jgi:frataxin